YPQLLVTKSAIRPGSNFNRQGGSIFHQRQHPLPKMSDLTPQSTDTGEVFSAASSIRSSPEKRNQIDDL
ncbi:hypothetical protein, partial [Ectopseudomonas chengduensis]|uniref:hypothetical protein n=1 Tax=Ectopseudomonas chengduensis TaxID=489632 RepID=UPI001ABF24AF